MEKWKKRGFIMFELLSVIEADILMLIQSARNRFFNKFFITVTKSGDHGFIWIIIAAVCLVVSVMFFILKKRKRADLGELTIGFAPALSLIFSFISCNLILKNAVARIRPYEAMNDLSILIPKESDASFPSGHSSAAFACSVALLIALPKKYKWIGVIAVIYASIMAFSRLYVGVHYPSDVVGGVLIGTACAFAGTFLIRRILEKTANRG
jgi:membrane-associated phospholipid phosphatase